MKVKVSAVFCIIIIFFYASCANQAENQYIAVPDEQFFIYEETIGVNIYDIIETQEGASSVHLPDWLAAFLYSGIEGVENTEPFSDRYVFIAVNESDRFTALIRWAENYSAVLDLPMLAAARIEKKLIKSASIYPDDEYGRFFERLVKGAYNARFPGAVKEDTYWIKIRQYDESQNDAASEIFMFFVLISIEKLIMQDLINDLITQTIDTVTSTRNQAVAINNIRQNFFEGF